MHAPIPVIARSKAWVCGRSLAGNVGSNSAGNIGVSCECCVLSGRGLCDGPINCLEESYRVGLSECDLETTTRRRFRPTRVVDHEKKNAYMLSD
jgi:hypothetical protein